MQYTLIAVVEGTQGLDYESHLVLKNELTRPPTSLTDFVGGQSRFSDGYISRVDDVVVRPISAHSNAVEIVLGRATWTVSAGTLLTEGQALDVSGDAKFDQLIITFVGKK
ncbi:hypothetical protein [Polaromonas sp. LjRoot131]|uniref:hypothetical protein n=1 Tax=Polaromonas sp. LjRoot131 TaxID=3342262 RepID=UPI003ED085D8